MTIRARVHHLLNVVVLLSLLLSPVQPLASAGPRAAAQAAVPVDVGAETSAPPSPQLFRTRVTVRNPNDWARLEKLGVVVLAEHRAADQGSADGRSAFPQSAAVLATADQLEALARLRFEPRSTDELGALVAAHAQAKPWLAASLKPLLAKAAAWQAEVQRSQGAEVQGSGGAEEMESPEVAAARADLRVAMRALTAEQKAGLAALTSVDDDDDGLTNTQEQWWCTERLNADSDGDGVSDGVEVQQTKDWLHNRRDTFPPSGPPFRGWPMVPGDGNFSPACVDRDEDSVPDAAETWDLGLNSDENRKGLNPNKESTDGDKFDDGQELFGITKSGWGLLPRSEDINYIGTDMPTWVKRPGNHPVVAAFPVPEVSVVPGSWHVERVRTITTERGQMTQTSKTYGSSVTRGESTSIANTVTWNNWEEVSQAVETPLSSNASRALTAPQSPAALPAIIGGAALLLGGAILGSVVDDVYEWVKEQFRGDDKKDDLQNQQPPNQYDITNINSNVANASASAEANASIVLNQNLDFQGVVNSLDGVQYAINRQGDLLARGLHDISYAISQPRFTETRTSGRSWGGAQTTTHEMYEEHTLSESQSFTTGENWSTAWAVDSSHAADLTFDYTVKNTGTEYARELTGIIFNIYLGDDETPIISYPAWQQFTDGKLENLFPCPDPSCIRTFASTPPVPLTLEQMKRIDLGERLTVVLANASYGIDEVFYQRAINGGVTVFVEDGVDDGDELVDSYVIPTWGTESVQDVLTRYFPAGYDVDGYLNSLLTPEFSSNPPVWNEHFLSDISWWNVYLTQADAGDTPLKDLPAVAGSAILFRFNRDSDRDGYSDRVEMRYGTDKNDPASHPQPEVLAGYVVTRTANIAMVKLVLENSGTFDAYGIDAVMYAPDGTTTIGNNTVGGNGRVRPGAHVAVGSLVKPPGLANWGSSAARPYSGGSYSGSIDRTYAFTVTTPGVVGQGNAAMR